MVKKKGSDDWRAVLVRVAAKMKDAPDCETATDATAIILPTVDSIRGQRAGNAAHDKTGGSREKQNAIRAIWASGKYSSRSICAEQECARIRPDGMSYDTARKALRNTPDPDPWPAKRARKK